MTEDATSGALKTFMNWPRGEYLLTDDRTRLDLDVVEALLRTTYWAAHRPRALIEQSLQHSVGFGLFHGDRQIGFARAVTDHATFTWICDVVIAAEHRGRGLGKWMVDCVLAHPDLQTASQVLGTRDAHTLYERFGFQRMEFLKRTIQDWSEKPPSGISRE